MDYPGHATGAYRLFQVSVINPAQAHHFAKALLQRAKTDAIDAQTLAQLATSSSRLRGHHRPRFTTSYSSVWPNVIPCSISSSRCVISSMRWTNCRRSLRTVRQRLEHVLTTFATQLAAVEAEIMEVWQQDTAWATAGQRLQSIKGIGWVTAAWTLVSTLNFTTCDTVEALTAYAGLAPMLANRAQACGIGPALGIQGMGAYEPHFTWPP